MAIIKASQLNKTAGSMFNDLVISILRLYPINLEKKEYLLAQLESIKSPVINGLPKGDNPVDLLEQRIVKILDEIEIIDRELQKVLNALDKACVPTEYREPIINHAIAYGMGLKDYKKYTWVSVMTKKESGFNEKTLSRWKQRFLKQYAYELGYKELADLYFTEN